MPKVNGATSKTSPLMHGNFSIDWKSQTWISFKDFRPPSPSSSAAPARGGSTRLTVTVSTAIGSTVQGWVNLDGEGDNDLHFAYYAHVGP